MNQKIYLHESVNIIGMNRPNYFEHITANWGHIAREERKMLCVGVWGTLGSTERWIEVINLWELDGWRGAARSFAHETKDGSMMDPSLKPWWEKAQQYRKSGYDRLLIPAPWSPTLEEALARDVSGKVYYHEVVNIKPGGARTYLELLEQHWLEPAGSIGLRLLGAYRSSMVNDSEAVVIWSMKDWDVWAGVEEAYESSEAVRDWRAISSGVVIDWRGKLLVPAPLSPTYTGKML